MAESLESQEATAQTAKPRLPCYCWGCNVVADLMKDDGTWQFYRCPVCRVTIRIDENAPSPLFLGQFDDADDGSLHVSPALSTRSTMTSSDNDHSETTSPDDSHLLIATPTPSVPTNTPVTAAGSDESVPEAPQHVTGKFTDVTNLLLNVPTPRARISTLFDRPDFGETSSRVSRSDEGLSPQAIIQRYTESRRSQDSDETAGTSFVRASTLLEGSSTRPSRQGDVRTGAVPKSKPAKSPRSPRSPRSRSRRRSDASDQNSTEVNRLINIICASADEARGDSEVAPAPQPIEESESSKSEPGPEVPPTTSSVDSASIRPSEAQADVDEPTSAQLQPDVKITDMSSNVKTEPETGSKSLESDVVATPDLPSRESTGAFLSVHPGNVSTGATTSAEISPVEENVVSGIGRNEDKIQLKLGLATSKAGGDVSTPPLPSGKLAVHTTSTPLSTPVPLSAFKNSRNKTFDASDISATKSLEDSQTHVPKSPDKSDAGNTICPSKRVSPRAPAASKPIDIPKPNTDQLLAGAHKKSKAKDSDLSPGTSGSSSPEIPLERQPDTRPVISLDESTPPLSYVEELIIGGTSLEDLSQITKQGDELNRAMCATGIDMSSDVSSIRDLPTDGADASAVSKRESSLVESRIRDAIKKLKSPKQPSPDAEKDEQAREPVGSTATAEASNKDLAKDTPSSSMCPKSGTHKGSLKTSVSTSKDAQSVSHGCTKKGVSFQARVPKRVKQGSPSHAAGNKASPPKRAPKRPPKRAPKRDVKAQSENTESD